MANSPIENAGARDRTYSFASAKKEEVHILT